MNSYLMFHLYGPLQSWGLAAPGEERQSADHPTKSGVLGLVASALGLARDADAAQFQLDSDLGYAVRVDASGTRLEDYQTVQAPKQSKLRPATRRDQLSWVSRNDLETLLTRRAYLVDACFSVALWLRGGQTELTRLQTALARPHYTPYLGRRNCPLAWPMCPQRVEAEHLAEAFARFPLHEDLRARLEQTRTGLDAGPQRCYWEGEVGMASHYASHQRDGLVSRQRRSFAERLEFSGSLKQSGG